jgi:hypothetical protein
MKKKFDEEVTRVNALKGSARSGPWANTAQWKPSTDHPGGRYQFVYGDAWEDKAWEQVKKR